MHSAFNLFVFPNSMFTSLLYLKGYVFSGGKHLKIAIIIVIALLMAFPKNALMCIKKSN